jgi:autoinducer 2-degrading protein
MIVTCVYVSVKPENVRQFIEATRINHIESVKEDGNLRFDLIQQADDSSKFMLYEAYESEADVDKHKTLDFYKNWRDQVENYMAEPRRWVRYNIIEPNNREKW